VVEFREAAQGQAAGGAGGQECGLGGAVRWQGDQGVQAGGDAVGGEAGEGGDPLDQELAASAVAQTGGADVTVVRVRGDEGSRR
jgi:hypothetical protein